jgi:hypothetical protein
MGGRRGARPVVLLGLALAFLAGALGAVATVDHRWKQSQIDDASVKTWFCEHENRMCGDDTPEELEERWVARERMYKGLAAGLLLAAPIGLFLVGSGRRRRLRAQERQDGEHAPVVLGRRR